MIPNFGGGVGDVSLWKVDDGLVCKLGGLLVSRLAVWGEGVGVDLGGGALVDGEIEVDSVGGEVNGRFP